MLLGNGSNGCGQRSLSFSRRNWDGFEPGERSDLQASQKMGAEPVHSQVALREGCRWELRLDSFVEGRVTVALSLSLVTLLSFFTPLTYTCDLRTDCSRGGHFLDV